MLALFADLQGRGMLVARVNPACPADIITDRWLGDLAAQEVFLRDLLDLHGKLRLLGGETGLEEKQVIQNPRA